MASDMDKPPLDRPARNRPARNRPASRRRAAGGAISARRRAGHEPEATDAASAVRPPGPPGPRSQKRIVVVLTVLTVVVAAIAGWALFLSPGSDKAGPAPAPDTPIPVKGFTDRQTGFTVEYPRSWRQVDVPLSDYRLALDGGNNVAFTVRVVAVAEAASTANLQNFKAVTDGLVGLNNSVTILKQQAVTYNGMLGYYYFYTFRDGPVEAVHAHYFLFSGKKMNILVFQAFPDDFPRLAATFDRVAESFRSDPKVELTGVAPITAPSTTVP